MRQFRDSKGQIWTIAVDVSAMKAVRGLLKIDLHTLMDDGFEGLNKLLSDPIAFGDVLYVLCLDQAKAAQITDEEFGRRLYGDQIADATLAFTEALIDFFPDPAIRSQMRTAVSKSKRVSELVMKKRQDALEKIDPEKIVEEAMRKTSNDSSGASPGSSELTPAS